MLGYIAALLFIIAFILRVTSTGTGVVFAPQSLLLAGLALLALHVAGVGGGWRITRRRLTRAGALGGRPRQPQAWRLDPPGPHDHGAHPRRAGSCARPERPTVVTLCGRQSGLSVAAWAGVLRLLGEIAANPMGHTKGPGVAEIWRGGTAPRVCGS